MRSARLTPKHWPRRRPRTSAAAPARPTDRSTAVAFVAKDNLDTRGLRTTFGSELMADYVPAEDAVCVERLRRAGAVLLGKANTPNSPTTSTPTTSCSGRPAIPQTRAAQPVGRAAAPAAAVASGMVPIGLGPIWAARSAGPSRCRRVAASSRDACRSTPGVRLGPPGRARARAHRAYRRGPRPHSRRPVGPRRRDPSSLPAPTATMPPPGAAAGGSQAGASPTATTSAACCRSTPRLANSAVRPCDGSKRWAVRWRRRASIPPTW